MVVQLRENGWSQPDYQSYFSKLSQERGTIKANDELFDKVKMGGLIGVLPIHSCMTADCMRKYIDFDGNVISRM